MDALEAEPDADLVPLALAGRREAWDVLIARHDRRVFLVLLARGVRVDRARDLTQETWARLIAQQQAGKLKWLELPGLAIRQALFLAVDEARRVKDVALDDAPEIALVVDPHGSPEDHLLSRAELEVATAELRRCSASAQRVFDIVYSDPSAPHADAARRAGISVQRLRQTLCEVRAKIRAALEQS